MICDIMKKMWRKTIGHTEVIRELWISNLNSNDPDGNSTRNLWVVNQEDSSKYQATMMVPCWTLDYTIVVTWPVSILTVSANKLYEMSSSIVIVFMLLTHDSWRQKRYIRHVPIVEREYKYFYSTLQNEIQSQCRWHWCLVRETRTLRGFRLVLCYWIPLA